MSSDLFVVKIAATTRSRAAAGAIAARLREQRACLVRAIGGRALYRALYALGQAGNFLAQEGIQLAVFPVLTPADSNQRTCFEFYVFRVPAENAPAELRVRLSQAENLSKAIDTILENSALIEQLVGDRDGNDGNSIADVFRRLRQKFAQRGNATRQQARLDA